MYYYCMFFFNVHKNNEFTGAFGGNIAVATAIKPFKTRVKASFSLSVAFPKCMVRVISVVPSNQV